MKRSVDVEGADHLVQLKNETYSELFKKKERIEVYGVVQSKYFESKNEVKIQKFYVSDEGIPRKEFFLFIHTDDENGNPVAYFFLADEIIKELRLRGEYYIFSITNDRLFEDYKNRGNNFIRESIKKNILLVEAERNNLFIGLIEVKEVFFNISGQAIERKMPQLSKSSIEILKKIDTDDVLLIRLFFSLLLSINGHLCIFPFQNRYLNVSNQTISLIIPYPYISIHSQGSAKQIQNKHQQNTNQVYFEIGKTLHSVTVVTDTGRFFYPLSENKTNFREINDATKSLCIGGVIVDVYKVEDNSSLCYHPISKQRQPGFFHHYLSNSDLARLNELNIINTDRKEYIYTDEIISARYFNHNVTLNNEYYLTPHISSFCLEVYPQCKSLKCNEDYLYFVNNS